MEVSSFFSYTLIGLFTGAAYAIAASGLVLTYSTTRVFNMAHGAFGMLFAFVYWDFSQRQHVPTWLSLVLVLLVAAPLAGLVVQRLFARGLGSAPVGVSLVVTVGIMVGLIGVATQVWPPAARTVPPFFADRLLTLGGVVVTYHQLVTILLSGLVAGGLYVLLNRTRIGTAMRASVDNPVLLQLHGGRPGVVAGLSWSIGTALAALAGILLSPVIGLQYYDLTLLVISAYAAAMLGRLTSLPLTYVGAMALGLTQAYAVGYLPAGGDLGNLRGVVPTLFLFAVIVAMPEAPLRIGQVKGLVSARVSSGRRSVGWGCALLLIALVLVTGLSQANLLLLGITATYAIVMLSLVLLTGYGGHVSLAQFTFAGVGALVYAKVDMPTLFGLVIAGLVAAAVGALVALPVLRLTGLYLALSTLAFAQLMDGLVFQASFAFRYNDSLSARRLSILGVPFSNTRWYCLLLVAVAVLVGWGVLAVRRGRAGRILIAMRDSQAACGTLGLDLRWFRVGLFAGSAGVAGLAGALFAGLRGSVGAQDFQFFSSLLLLLAAVVWGITSVTGAWLGGLFVMYLPVAQGDHPQIAGLLFVLLGLGAVALGRDPNGLANKIFGFNEWVTDRLYPTLVRRYPGMALPVRGDRDVLEPQEVQRDVVVAS
jgi:branched-chain amino acid transport system permease protein